MHTYLEQCMTSLQETIPSEAEIIQEYMKLKREFQNSVAPNLSIEENPSPQKSIQNEVEIFQQEFQTESQKGINEESQKSFEDTPVK